MFEKLTRLTRFFCFITTLLRSKGCEGRHAGESSWGLLAQHHNKISWIRRYPREKSATTDFLHDGIVLSEVLLKKNHHYFGCMRYSMRPAAFNMEF